ncbi:MAG: hypothetical protein ABWZ98_14410, partial [Nakamurella sp.]
TDLVPISRRTEPSTRAEQSTSAPRPGPSPDRRVRPVVCLIGAAGLVFVVLGSFLPWVISGEVRRSSYQIAGVVGRLGIGEGGLLAVLLGAWPFIGVLCTAPVLAAAFRWWRTAGSIGVLIGLISGLLSFGLLIFVATRGGAILRVDPIGPSVMAAGAVLLICAGPALWIRSE